jgi:hypothetical protein
VSGEGERSVHLTLNPPDYSPQPYEAISDENLVGPLVP